MLGASFMTFQSTGWLQTDKNCWSIFMLVHVRETCWPACKPLLKSIILYLATATSPILPHPTPGTDQNFKLNHHTGTWQVGSYYVNWRDEKKCSHKIWQQSQFLWVLSINSANRTEQLHCQTPCLTLFMKPNNIQPLTSMSCHPVGGKTSKRNLQDSVRRAIMRTHKDTKGRQRRGV